MMCALPAELQTLFDQIPLIYSPSKYVFVVVVEYKNRSYVTQKTIVTTSYSHILKYLVQIIESKYT